VAAGFSDSTIKLWDLSQDKSHWNEMTQLYSDTDGTRLFSTALRFDRKESQMEAKEANRRRRFL
jgi:hypothetical protein